MTTTRRHSITPRFQALLELPSQRLSRSLDMALAIFLFLLLTCSSAYAANEYDPFEKVNRVTFGFNVALDRAILKPLASGYDNYTPKVAKAGVRNFFNNLDDVRVGVNDLLQLNFTQATKDFGRFAVNSTVGVAGLFDVAEQAFNLDKNRQDFGKTLAHWGVGSGPYLVLPIIGPSTARDALGFGVDTVVDTIPSINHVSSRNSLLATKSTDRRADYLSFDDLIIGDDYLFVRGIYLQSRGHAINGGSYTELAFDDF
jgi:phospholipid-binding lipoprotein MlaA